MTARQAFDSLLTELNKVNAPSMLIQDFNYFINKAIGIYINKRYNIYDINQQTTDDLRVLKATSILDVSKNNKLSKLYGATYEVYFPLDYLHLLNCICVYELNEKFQCNSEGDIITVPAKKLTADSWMGVITNYYNRPNPKQPYYYINNINTSTDIPTNPVQKSAEILNRNTIGTDANSDYKVTKEEVKSNLPRKINLKDIENKSVINRETGQRYGNSSSIRCEIRYGDDSKFKLKNIIIDYLKTPQTIRLTQQQVNLTEDTSQILEFPDYGCQEIMNELVTLVMENIADTRLQPHIAVTQSIANPAQQQTQTK